MKPSRLMAAAAAAAILGHDRDMLLVPVYPEQQEVALKRHVERGQRVAEPEQHNRKSVV